MDGKNMKLLTHLRQTAHSLLQIALHVLHYHKYLGYISTHYHLRDPHDVWMCKVEQHVYLSEGRHGETR